MSISRKIYDQILKEYDEKQLAVLKKLKAKTAALERELPQLSLINSQIASNAVESAIAGIRASAPSAGIKYDHQRKLAELMAAKENILQNAGYSLKDLEASYSCELCKDSGFTDGEPCICFKRRLTDLLYDSYGIREVLQHENFDNYSLKYYDSTPSSKTDTESPAAAAKKAYAAAKEFVANFPVSSDNLLICGETGVGKTFLANCIAKELLDRGFFVIYLSSVRFFDLLAESQFRSDRDSSDHITDYIRSCDLLIIDDLGTELVNSFVHSSFFNCINERLLAKRHTIISTNLSIMQIRDTYSERIFSRIAKDYKLIKLYGKDIRIIKKMEA